MKKYIAKIIPLVLCLLLVACLLVSLAGCNDEDLTEPKRAIIVMPGILGSALWNTDTDTPCWDPLTIDIELVKFFDDPINVVLDGFARESKNGTNAMQLIFDLLDLKEGCMLERIQMDDNGVPYYDAVQPVKWEQDVPQRYGALGAYKEPWQIMEDRYGEYYDVQVFQYDWRLSVEDGAADLEKFINEKGYDEVILAPHSMGNCVIARYLAKEENRKKVVGYCAYAPPYYGAVAAISMLEDPDGLVDGLRGLDFSKLGYPLSNLSKRVDDVFDMYEICKQTILFTMPAVAELLPTIELIDEIELYYGDEFVDPLDGSEITTNEALCRFYSSRPWARYVDDEGKEQVRSFVAELGDLFESQYVTVNGEKVFAASLVNTHYFLGTNVPSTEYVTFDSQTGFSSSLTLNPYSDGTVENASSLNTTLLKSINKTYDEVVDDINTAIRENKTYVAYDNVTIMINHSHLDCGNCVRGDLLKRTYEFVDSIIPKHILDEIRDDFDEDED